MRERAVGASRQGGGRGVELYLDRDRSGRELAGWFRRELADLDVADRSGRYAGHKDVNEYWVAQRDPATKMP